MERAIETFQKARQLIPSDSPNLVVILVGLGTGLEDRYHLLGRLEDLEKAIEVYQEALQHAPSDSPNLAFILIGLGHCLHTLYEHTGTLEDLERAIEAVQEAARLTPNDSPSSSIYLDNLGVCLRARYRRTGRLEDLHQAITAHQEAVQHASRGSSQLARCLSNLGNVLHDRFSHTKRQEDLEQVIAAFQEAVRLTPIDSPELPRHLNSLGMSLYSYYGLTEKLRDLEEVITVFQQVIQHTPIESPKLSTYLSNFGASLYTRYQRTAQLENLEQAIRTYQAAEERIPANALLLPSFLDNLGTVMKAHYTYTTNLEDMQKAIASYEKACRKGLEIDIVNVLTSASTWGDWAMERASWTEAIQAYTYGMQAIEELYRTQLLRTSQETWLSEARGLHTKAAYALAQAGHQREAIETLEQGRARILSETLARDHANLERVRLEDQEAYSHYHQAAERLRQFERAERDGNLLAEESTALMIASPVEQIGQARKELEQAIIRIRQISGFENFLVKPTYDDVVQARQRDNPLVYLATTNWGSLALLLHPASDAPEVIWAENFTSGHLNALLVKREGDEVIGGYLFGQLSNSQWLSKALNEMLPQLGRDLTGPISSRLRELGAKGVVLIPTGLLMLLPLHAALYQSNNREVCLLDEFDVAYTPSARVLAAAQREAEKRLDSVSGTALQFVGIGNPLADPEVGVWVQEELRRIVPILQEGISLHILRLQDSVADLPSEERIWIRHLFGLWEQTLQHLQALCRETPEQLIYSGSVLQRAAGLFADLTDLADDIGATLIRLAKRIPASLTYAHAELESVLTLLPRDSFISFYEHQATRTALWNILPQATIAHFACHGSFDLEVPLDSALMLARETRLTLRDLLNAEPQHLTNLHLTFLSACQTAITDFLRLPNEAVGLLSGFLQAGVPSVVGTLWSVDDLSTALLVTRFYEQYLQGDQQSNLPRQQPARALRLAQDWLRKLTNNNLYTYLSDSTSAQHISPKLRVEQLPLLRQAIRQGQGEEHPYADPYYWAPFVYYGTL